MDHNPDRRHVLKVITIGGVATALLLPSRWTKPIIESIVVPAHAQASPRGTTTSTTTTFDPPA